MTTLAPEHPRLTTDETADREVAWAMEFIAGQIIRPLIQREALKRTPTTVYVCRDDSDRVLYVGVSVEAHTRFRAHVKKEWWIDVAVIALERFPDRQSALNREAELIASLNPLHNIAKGAIK